MEKILRKVEYTTKKKLNMTADNVSEEAKKVIAEASDDDTLVLRVRVNSPVYIEAAALLTSDGIKEVCKF